MDEDLQQKLRRYQGAKRILGDPVAVDLIELMKRENYLAMQSMPIDATYEELKIVQLNLMAVTAFERRLKAYIEDYDIAKEEPEEEISANI